MQLTSDRLTESGGDSKLVKDLSGDPISVGPHQYRQSGCCSFDVATQVAGESVPPPVSAQTAAVLVDEERPGLFNLHLLVARLIRACCGRDVRVARLCFAFCDFDLIAYCFCSVCLSSD